MRVVVDGKPQGLLTAEQEGNISSVRKEERVEGRVLTLAEASQALGREGRLVFTIVAIALVLFIDLPAVIAIGRNYDAIRLSVLVAVNLVLMLALFFWFRRLRRASDAELAARALGLPPAGTKIAFGETGLLVGGRLMPWLALRINQVDLTEDAGEHRSFFIERLSLSDTNSSVVLDRSMIEKGALILGNVCRRLRTGTA